MQRDCISGWSRRRTTQRQDLGRGWPARKLITKKEGAGGGARRMGGKRGRHSELSAHSVRFKFYAGLSYHLDLGDHTAGSPIFQ